MAAAALLSVPWLAVYCAKKNCAAGIGVSATAAKQPAPPAGRSLDTTTVEDAPRHPVRSARGHPADIVLSIDASAEDATIDENAAKKQLSPEMHAIESIVLDTMQVICRDEAEDDLPYT